MPTKYEGFIIKAFQDLCKKQKSGASPAEVTSLLAKRKQLTALDSVLDIADLMKDLRGRDLL